MQAFNDDDSDEDIHKNEHRNDSSPSTSEDENDEPIQTGIKSISLSNQLSANDLDSNKIYSSFPDGENVIPITTTDGDEFTFANKIEGIVRPRVIYKGRKYDWRAKVNLHVHIVEHVGADCFELIGFNSSTFSEAHHVYTKASFIFKHVADESTEEKAEAIMLEYHKLKIVAPGDDFIFRGLLNYKAANFLIDHMFVQTKPVFSIDIKIIDPNSSNKTSNRRPSLLPKQQEEGGKGGIHSRLSVPDTMLSSISFKKPEKIIESEVKRYGKSATLVGEVSNVKTLKEDEVLFKIISSLSFTTTNPLTNQAKRIINRLSLQPNPNHAKRKSKHVVENILLRSFAKFRADNDLLQESLSFLHISDMVILQSVCKRWKVVLAYAIKTTSSLYLTSREYYFSEEVETERMREGRVISRTASRMGSRMGSRLSSRQAPLTPSLPALTAPREFKLLSSYLLPETSLRLLRNCNKHLVELQLHYVVLSLEMIGYLACLSGRLKKLSLGTVKIDDKIRKIEEKVERKEKTDSTSPKKPTVAPPPSNRYVLNRRYTSPASQHPPHLEETAKEIESHSHPSPLPALPHVDVSTLRFMNSADLKAVLFSCGAELHTLELSVMVGEIKAETFQFAPKLSLLVMHDSLLAPRLLSAKKDVQGYVNPQMFVQALQGIPMPDLLCLIGDAQDEPFLLTDRRGKIVVANEAWERAFGYKVEDIAGGGIDFLIGGLTNVDTFHIIGNGLKSQVQAEEVRVFLNNKEGRPLLCQVILIPNVAKYRGNPLQTDCLGFESLGQMALEQEEGGPEKVKIKGKRDWKVTNKELSYHLLRFGILSQPFTPYNNLFVRQMIK